MFTGSDPRESRTPPRLSCCSVLCRFEPIGRSAVAAGGTIRRRMPHVDSRQHGTRILAKRGKPASRGRKIKKMVIIEEIHYGNEGGGNPPAPIARNTVHVLRKGIFSVPHFHLFSPVLISSVYKVRNYLYRCNIFRTNFHPPPYKIKYFNINILHAGIALPCRSNAHSRAAARCNFFGFFKAGSNIPRTAF